MISGYLGAAGKAPLSTQAARRLHAIGMLQPLAGLVLAAGFVLCLAGRYEAQLIREAHLHQEVIGQ